GGELRRSRGDHLDFRGHLHRGDGVPRPHRALELVRTGDRQYVGGEAGAELRRDPRGDVLAIGGRRPHHPPRPAPPRPLPAPRPTPAAAAECVWASACSNAPPSTTWTGIP